MRRGEVVRHAGQVFLKVSASAYAVLEDIRARYRELAFSS